KTSTLLRASLTASTLEGWMMARMSFMNDLLWEDASLRRPSSSEPARKSNVQLEGEHGGAATGSYAEHLGSVGAPTEMFRPFLMPGIEKRIFLIRQGIEGFPLSALRVV